MSKKQWYRVVLDLYTDDEMHPKLWMWNDLLHINDYEGDAVEVRDVYELDKEMNVPLTPEKFADICNERVANKTWEELVHLSNELQDRLAVRDLQIADLTADLQKQIEWCTSVNAELDKRRTDLLNKDAVIEQQQKDIAALQEENNKQAEDILRLSVACDKSVDEIVKLTKESNELHLRCTALQKEKDNASDSLYATIAALQEENNRQLQENDRLKAFNTGLHDAMTLEGDFWKRAYTDIINRLINK